MTHRLIILLSIVLTLGCATSPEGRKQLMMVSDGQMAEMGRQGFDEVKKKMTVESDPAINRYVQCVATPLLRVADPENPKWEIVVFKEPSANAFALPGRKIGVHTGLLTYAKTPDQLAAVLGHEVGHVLAHHGAERVSEAMAAQGGMMVVDTIVSGKKTGQNDWLMGALGLGVQGLYLLPHSRAQESEADIMGLRLMARAGFDPRDAVRLWQNMKAAGGQAPPEILSTHPANDTRIRNLQSHISEVLPDYEKVGSRVNCSL